MTHRRHQLVIRWHGNFSHLWGFPPARLFHSQFYCRVELRNVATREGSSLERGQSAAASPPSRLMVTSCKPRTTAHLPLKQTCVAIARIMMCTTPERETVCVASNSISAPMSMCCVFYSLVNVRFQLFLQLCEAASAENTFPCSAASQ